MTLPPSVSSAGEEAIELAESAGLVLDPWERLVLTHGLGERSDGKWSAFELGLVVPRQNGKGAILEAIELAGLYLFGEDLILHSAHEFKTAAEAFRRLLALVDGTADLSRRIRKVRTSHGDEGIELITGQRVRFVARSRGSGRGFSGDRVILDEAFNLSTEGVAALLPTMAARPNPQIVYTSSAPLHLEMSAVLRRLARRGRAGTSARLAYFEWCAEIPEELGKEIAKLPPAERYAHLSPVLDDRKAWAAANPGLGIRITEEFIESEREAMGDEEFARERLGIWFDDQDEGLIPEATWDLMCSPVAQPGGDITFAADVNPERSAAAILAIGTWTDPQDRKEYPTAEVVEHRAGVNWLAGRLRQLDEKWDSPFIAVDGRNTAPIASMLPELRREGATLVEVNAGDMPAACGRVYDQLVDTQIRVRRHPSLDAAIKGADRQYAGDAYTWSRRNSSVDICPLVCLTTGLWVASEMSAPNIY